MNSLDQAKENLKFYISIRYDAYLERLEKAFQEGEVLLGDETSQNNIIKEYGSAKNFVSSTIGDKENFIEKKIKEFESGIESSPQEYLVSFMPTLDIVFGEIQPQELNLILESIKNDKIKSNTNSIFWLSGTENVMIVNNGVVCEIPMSVLSNFFNSIVESSVNYSPKFKYEVDFEL